jgi:hypothetical protein
VFALFNVIVHVAQIVEKRRTLIMLDDWQLSGLREPSQLSGTHSKVCRRLFRPN